MCLDCKTAEPLLAEQTLHQISSTCELLVFYFSTFNSTFGNKQASNASPEKKSLFSPSVVFYVSQLDESC